MPRLWASLVTLGCLLFAGCGDDTGSGAGHTGGGGAGGGTGATSSSGGTAGAAGGLADGGGGSQSMGGAGGDGGAGGAPVDPACEALGASLQAAIEEHYQSSQPSPGGASVAVIRGSCRWVGAVGEAQPGEPMTTDHHFRIASVTKTFVATTLLKLVDEGLVGLDDTLDQYVPSLPNGDKITVRMVLDHRSGLFDYLTDAAFWQQALAQPNTAVTPQALVDVATSHAPTFAPGQGWGYTNTGFILAGMVIEAVTDTSAGAAIHARTIDPVGLSETSFDGEDPLPSPMAHGFGTQGEDLTFALHPSVNWTAGAMVATAGDLADWAKALYGGQVLPPAALAEMLTPVGTGIPGLDYGLGAFLYDASKVGNISDAVGHGGNLPGYKTDMMYLTNDGTVVVQMTNADAGPNYTGVLLVTLVNNP
ncbi:MAG: serine hydrolase domain-containing protein [Polyangiaceae bacterium]